MTKRPCFQQLSSALLVFFAIFSGSAAYAEGEPSIIGFSPQGEIKGVRQATARFSDQMVSFGMPEIADPFDIACPASGKGRWADGKNWIFDFDKDLEAGVRCTFTLKNSVKTLRGKPLQGRKSFSFSTGGPKVTALFPHEDSEEIEEDQIFALKLDGPAAESSFAGKLSFLLEATGERLGARVLKGKDRENIISVLKRTYWLTGADKPEQTVVIQCKRAFPNNGLVQLVWGKGIASPGGIATSKNQVFHFKTRPPFSAKFECRRENPRADCIPLLPVTVSFSAPVSRKHAEKVSLKGKDKTYAPFIDKEGEDNLVRLVRFKGPFPEKTVFALNIPRTVKDEAGRTLSNASMFPLTVKTGPYPPLAKFSSRFGIIEKADPVLPVTIRSIGSLVQGKLLDVGDESRGPESKAPEGTAQKKQETSAAPSKRGTSKEISENVTGKIQQVGGDVDIITWLRKVAAIGRSRSLLEGNKEAKAFTVPKAGGNRPTEVVGIKLDGPGLYVVELKSEILGASLLGGRKPFYVPTAALVTNLSAHFKWGRESSLVWVTTLDKAEPVQGAAVAIRDCTGKAIWQGTTDSRGIALVGKGLPPSDKLPQCSEKSDEETQYDSDQIRALASMNSGLFVFARTVSDTTFVHSSWEDGIEPYRFGLPPEEYTAPVIAHTILDRPLFRAGETVHMKHILRKQSTSGISLVTGDFPDTLRIEQINMDEKYEFSLKWDPKKGSSETSWVIPKGAKLGSYSVSLVKKGKDSGSAGIYDPTERVYRSGEFKVQEFRVPLMKATVKPLVDPVVNSSELAMDLFVEYLSGGGAANLPVTLRSRVQPKSVFFDGYESFSLANGAVKTGVEKRGRHGEMEIEEQDEGEQTENVRPASRRDKSLSALDLKLGQGGMIRTTVQGIPLSPGPQNLVSELEFRDPNGEIQTVSRITPLWPSSLITGVDAEATGPEGTIKIKLLALDLGGKPLPGTMIKGELFKESRYSHRKRLVGGFYSYEHVTERKPIGPACEGETDREGILRCEVKSPVSGSVIVQAKSVDASGNTAVAHHTTWVPGKDEWWFGAGSGDRIDLIPEKKHYQPGETAAFQVRMPMREATVLVTVEREGIMEARVERLTGKNPVIKLLVKESWSPNVFVSALCLRGRVADFKPTALVDLGRPSYKLGIAGVTVGWAGHELKVTVTPDKEVYKVRDKALTRIKVRTANGKALPPGGEVAIAAVDEGLLELMPNRSWNLLEKMMQKRGYGILTSTAQTQVMGKRHYGLKALPWGGGGGKQLTRELFDTLLLWKGALALDKNGEASIEIPLSDSLTGFTIVAVATAGQGLFGTGQARIRTTQDLILTSGLPPVVRQGDRFRAGFAVRNTTQGALETEITATLTKGKEKKTLPILSEQIAPGEAKDIGWDIIVPPDGDVLKWEVSARAKESDKSDTIRISQRVAPYASARIVQATLSRIEGKQSMEVEPPKGALPGKGGIRVLLKPKLSDNTAGMTEYMDQYPYTCLEQQVSRAVSLGDKAGWSRIMAQLPSYMDKNGLVKYFPILSTGSEVLTAYILSIAHEAGWEVPPDSAGKMEEGLKRFVEGKLYLRQPIPTSDLTLRKVIAIEALSRRGKGEAKLLDSISIDPNLWPTSVVIDWTNILMRVKGVPDREKRLLAAQQIIRSRLNFQGTSMGFSTEKTDRLWWLMAGGDVNSVRAVLTFLSVPSWREDIPRMMRGAVGRQKKGRWDTTIANAWGKLALAKFGSSFEKETVAGVTDAQLDRERQTLNWASSTQGGTLSFGWPKGKKTLSLSHSGTGKPWAFIQSLAAVPGKTPFSSGYTIKRKVTPITRKTPEGWTTGDVVRVRIEAEAVADMTWVALTDPIPAGATILGNGLGRDSTLLAAGEKQGGRVWPVHVERSFETFRAYYDYVPKGKWFLEYTFRLNNQGVFLMPATRIEALYAPEMFGEMPNGIFEVK
jgi:uncharacterized protein YfaS (alpha-2-macroglobulin family)